MTYFTPTPITPLNARAVIDDAYRAGGLNPPTIVDALDELLQQEPASYELAIEYATAALDGTRSSDDLLNEAVTRIIRAQAVEKFRDVYIRTVEQIAFDRIDTARAQAATDLAAPFGKLTKALAKHTANLPTRDPLNRDAAFENDTTSDWRATTDLLQRLSRFVFTSAGSAHFPGVATQLLAIVNVPDVTPERTSRRGMVGAVSVHDDASSTRNRIRHLVKGAQSDPDGTLLRIARGDMPGITLELASPDEHARRIAAAENAHRQITDTARAVIL